VSGRLTRASVISALALLPACSGDDGDEAPDAAATTGAGGQNTAGTGGTATTFAISFEYAYDTSGYFDEAKRRALSEAAASWTRYIASEFDDVPAGTALRARHPEHLDREGMVFELDYAIDDLVVLMGSSPIDGMGMSLASSSSSFTTQIADAALLEALRGRYDGQPFQPWMAQTTFDSEEWWAVDSTPESDDDLVAGDNDFISTAIHELGHVLGIGSAAAFDALVEAGRFVGPRAMEVHGGPVPLAADGVHFERDTLSNGKLPSLELGTAPGQRKRPTELDLAVLEDLGYTIRWELVN